MIKHDQNLSKLFSSASGAVLAAQPRAVHLGDGRRGDGLGIEGVEELRDLQTQILRGNSKQHKTS